MKTVVVRFEFTEADWQHYKVYYSDKDIRRILEEGGISELDTLTNQLIMSERSLTKELRDEEIRQLRYEIEEVEANIVKFEQRLEDELELLDELRQTLRSLKCQDDTQ